MSANKQQDVQADTEQGGKRQSSTGHVAESGLHTNFAHASPDSNVNPPGKPQSSHGSATEEVPGAAPRSAADKASGGPSYGQQVVNSSGGAGMDRDS